MIIVLVNFNKSRTQGVLDMKIDLNLNITESFKMVIMTKTVYKMGHKAKVKAYTNNGHKVAVSFDDSITTQDNHKAACKALCEDMDWQGDCAMGQIEDNDHYVFVFTS